MKNQILYTTVDGDGLQLTNFITINKDSITIYDQHAVNFGISIIVGEADIYSVDTTGIEPEVTKAFEFNTQMNYAYTIYPKTKDILVRVTDDNGDWINYQMEFIPYSQPEHYNDQLTNRNLPNYDELKDCILFTDDYDQTNLVARMLLEANLILKHKGNIKGIARFLNFVGFPNGSFDLYREYIQPNKQTTINPNYNTDIPTGYYHLMIRNYIQDGSDVYTRKNLPNLRNLINQSLDEFLEVLRRSLAIASKYFTLPEQDISFIGIETSSNGMGFVSIAGNTTMITTTNPQLFAKSINIWCNNHYTSDNINKVIERNISTNTTIYKSEVKYLGGQEGREIFFIDAEVFDDKPLDWTFDSKRIFGSINHLYIESPDTYVTVKIQGIDNVFLELNNPKQYVGDKPLEIKYLSTQSGRYKITVTVHDLHNNREVYEFEYTMSLTKINAKFDILTSHIVSEDYYNGLTQEITSSSATNVKTDNYILPQHLVPLELKDYYGIPIESQDVKYQTNNPVYLTKPINPNYSIDSLTETIGIDFVDNYLHILSIPLIDDYVELVLRPKSISKELNDDGTYFPLSDIYGNTYNFEPDCIFSTVMDIYLSVDDYNKNISHKYLFLTTTEAGIDLNTTTFDIGLLKTDGTVISVYDLVEDERKIPLNYDFPLFHRENDIDLIKQNKLLWPKFVYNADTPQETDIIIKSIFPRLSKLSQSSVDKSNVLMFGDFIVATIDTDTIVGELNMSWKVYNAFTGELLHNTNDYSLKYRVNENTIYTIVLELYIDTIVQEERYMIDRRSVVSSFKLNY